METISWIFLALAIASKNESVDYAEISEIADGINHSVPTLKEIEASILWLKSKKMILKTGNKFALSEYGKKIYNETVQETKQLFKMREIIENKISLQI
jgi:predicted transcriptional regulator